MERLFLQLFEDVCGGLVSYDPGNEIELPMDEIEMGLEDFICDSHAPVTISIHEQTLPKGSDIGIENIDDKNTCSSLKLSIN